MQFRTVFILAVLILSPVARAQEPRTTSGELNEKAIAQVNVGNLEKAIELFRQARALMPTDPTLRKNLAATHSQLGVKLVAAGKIEEAVKQLRISTSLEPV